MMEIPEFKKCCFYIPLRPGLIAWGYFNVVLALVMLGLGLNQLIMDIIYNYNDTYNSLNASVTFLVLTFLAQSLLAIVHLAFNILLVVAGHKISPRLLNIYYNYAKYRIVGYLTAMVAVNLIFLAGPYNMTSIVGFFLDATWLFLLAYNPAVGIIDILFQCYFVLLLRSYLISLGHNNQFKPLENETENTEPECTMEIEREGRTDKIVIKNIKIKYHS